MINRMGLKRMKEKICIINFFNEETRLFQLVNDIEVAVLRSWLYVNKFETMTYVEKELPSIIHNIQEMKLC